MVGNSPMQQPAPSRRSGQGAWVAGVILVVVGALLLFGEVVARLDTAWWRWPYTVIGVGLILVVAGLLFHRPARNGFLIPGFIVTNAGLVLLFQEMSGNWESWAYLWPIVAPGGVALALIVGALLDRDGSALRSGLVLLGVSAAMVLVFTFFFEGMIFGDWLWGSWLWQPWVGGALVMAIGAVLLLVGLLRRS